MRLVCKDWLHSCTDMNVMMLLYRYKWSMIHQYITNVCFVVEKLLVKQDIMVFEGYVQDYLQNYLQDYLRDAYDVKQKFGKVLTLDQVKTQFGDYSRFQVYLENLNFLVNHFKSMTRFVFFNLFFCLPFFYRILPIITINFDMTIFVLRRHMAHLETMFPKERVLDPCTLIQNEEVRIYNL